MNLLRGTPVSVIDVVLQFIYIFITIPFILCSKAE